MSAVNWRDVVKTNQMKSITNLTQSWYSDTVALPQLIERLSELTKNKIDIDIQGEYIAEELDDILENRQFIKDQKEIIAQYEVRLKEDVKIIVDTLKELGISPEAKVNVDITTNDDFEITVKIWYNYDDTLGHEFYNEIP